MVGKTKPDFIGKRSLSLPDMVAPGRKKLVGLMTVDPNTVLEEGAQVVADPAQPIPMKMLGHVTSSYMSATLGRSFAMALVANADKGQRLFVPTPDGAIEVEVTEPVFFDPKGERLDG
jgi:sarcosine oxidase subunit alpha